MVLELREWVMIGSAALMLLVVGHAVWLRLAHRKSLRLELEPVPADSGELDDLQLVRGELPNGRSRPVRPPPGQQANIEARVPVLDAVTQGSTGAGSDATVGGPDDAGALVADAPMTRSGNRHAVAPDPRNRSGAVRTAAPTRAPTTPTAGASSATPGPSELIVVNVMSREAPADGFPGRALVQVVSGCGLKFGDMNIFHRYFDGKPGAGNKIFSMACAVKPGTFDLATLDDSVVPGVSLFMDIGAVAEPLAGFEDMLDVARHIAHELDGDLLDERRSAMTPQTIEHLRERIRDYTRRNGH